MRYLQVTNKGEIDVEAFKLIGASTKRDDPNQIGQFGSGLKYAIAYLLRESIQFRVFVGEYEIEFSIVDKVLRGQTFQVITINNVETSMTTSMGLDWEPWFAIREIYSNALDEDKESTAIVTDWMEPREGKTTFMISLEDDRIQDVVDNWDHYFIGDREVISEITIEGETIKLYATKPEDKGVIIFKNGIRVYHDPSKPSVFHYDISDIVINEMRTVMDTWDLKAKVVSIICKAGEDVIKYFISNVTDKSFEAFLQFDYNDFNEDWENVLKSGSFVSYEYYNIFKDKTNLERHRLLPNSIFKRLVESKKYHSHFSFGSYSRTSILPVKAKSFQERLTKLKNKLSRRGFFKDMKVKPALFAGSTLSDISNDDKTLYIASSLESKSDRELLRIMIVRFINTFGTTKLIDIYLDKEFGKEVKQETNEIKSEEV